MTVWFTSDTHFGHKRIIELAKRPFPIGAVEEMDERLIRNWNDVVDINDDVYHLGDFSFKKPSRYISRLNGRVHLIYGNHDDKEELKKCLQFASQGDYLEITVEGIKIVLFHYAMRVWNKSGHGSLHFYGHSHGNLPGDNQSCDVGVDSWNQYPVCLDNIKARLRTSPKRGEPDHHGRKEKIICVHTVRVGTTPLNGTHRGLSQVPCSPRSPRGTQPFLSLWCLRSLLGLWIA
jgi:calcineurin-like phosphoesterase family protein